MCGVVGLLLRDRSLEPALGSMLVSMIEALDERGPDSSGIAVYSDHHGSGAGLPGLVKISVGSDDPVDWADVQDVLSIKYGSAVDLQPFGAGMVITTPDDFEEEIRS